MARNIRLPKALGVNSNNAITVARFPEEALGSDLDTALDSVKYDLDVVAYAKSVWDQI